MYTEQQHPHNMVYSTIDSPRKTSNGGAVPEPVHDEESQQQYLKYSRSQHILRDDTQNKQSFSNNRNSLSKKMTILHQNETVNQLDNTSPHDTNAQFNINRNKIQVASANINQHRSQNELQKEYNLSEKDSHQNVQESFGPEPVSKYIIGLPNPHRLSNFNS